MNTLTSELRVRLAAVLFAVAAVIVYADLNCTQYNSQDSGDAWCLFGPTDEHSEPTWVYFTKTTEVRLLLYDPCVPENTFTSYSANNEYNLRVLLGPGDEYCGGWETEMDYFETTAVDCDQCGYLQASGAIILG